MAHRGFLRWKAIFICKYQCKTPLLIMEVNHLLQFLTIILLDTILCQWKYRISLLVIWLSHITTQPYKVRPKRTPRTVIVVFNIITTLKLLYMCYNTHRCMSGWGWVGVWVPGSIPSTVVGKNDYSALSINVLAYSHIGQHALDASWINDIHLTVSSDQGIMPITSQNKKSKTYPSPICWFCRNSSDWCI